MAIIKTNNAGYSLAPAFPTTDGRAIALADIAYGVPNTAPPFFLVNYNRIVYYTVNEDGTTDLEDPDDIIDTTIPDTPIWNGTNHGDVTPPKHINDYGSDGPQAGPLTANFTSSVLATSEASDAPNDNPYLHHNAKYWYEYPDTSPGASYNFRILGMLSDGRYVCVESFYQNVEDLDTHIRTNTIEASDGNYGIVPNESVRLSQFFLQRYFANELY